MRQLLPRRHVKQLPYKRPRQRLVLSRLHSSKRRRLLGCSSPQDALLELQWHDTG